MTQQNHGHFGYQTVQLIKTEPLGTGSYGAVYKARCDDLACAGKILHPILFQSNHPGAMTVMRRFQQECSFLSAIRHPNVVQYLGSYQDPETRLPVLLMELMDESLTQFLERSQRPLPYLTQVNICHDITLALAYLHSNDILHRDLSSNNVLLTCAGNRAKVADFGMVKLFDVNHATMTPQTMCPGTQAYMSPEALDDPPVYTKKLDTFSFGVLSIQIITRKFPNPGARMKKVRDSRFPVGIQVPVPETERRKSHIDLIDPTHPLLPITINCLSYSEEQRPSAEDLCRSLAALKETPRYGDSMQRAQERSRLVAHSTTEERERQLRQLQQDTAKGKLTLSWKVCNAAPRIMQRGSAAVCGGLAYFRPGGSKQVLSYNSDTEEWSTLPECPRKYFTLTVVNGLATAIGGEQSTWHGDKITNTVLSLLPSEGGRWKWVEHFPPMPTKRFLPVVMCSRKALVVAGGNRGGDKALATVEVMDTDTLQWSTASSLPQPLSDASATVCGGRIYLIGSLDHRGHPAQSVFTCSLNTLLQSRTVGAKMKTLSLAGNHTVWHTITDLPVKGSTCVTLNEQLLAVSGFDRRGRYTNNIYMYNTQTSSWEIISHMPHPRCRCLVTVLPGNKMMVVGGQINTGDTDKIEIATVQ